MTGTPTAGTVAIRARHPSAQSFVGSPCRPVDDTTDQILSDAERLGERPCPCTAVS
jgi:hypothetical protein